MGKACLPTPSGKLLTRKRSRRLQFGLKALLLAFIPLSCLCSYLGCAMRQRRAVAELKELGASVCYDDPYWLDFQVVVDRLQLRPSRGWGGPKTTWENLLAQFAEVTGPDFVYNVSYVSLTAGVPVDEGTFKVICRLPHLGGLELNYSVVGDPEISRIATLRSLEQLSLQGSELSGHGLQQLGRLSRLSELDLFKADIGDSSLTFLRDLARLRALGLDANPITDQGLEVIADCTQLETLALGRTDISDHGLHLLKKLTRLQCLDLRLTNVTDAGIIELQELRQLKILDVRGTWITAEGAQTLKRLLPETSIREDATRVYGRFRPNPECRRDYDYYGS